MKCKICNKPLTVMHTMTSGQATIKRRRKCANGHMITTFERPKGKALSDRERRLLARFAEINNKQKTALWAVLRTF